MLKSKFIRACSHNITYKNECVDNKGNTSVQWIAMRISTVYHNYDNYYTLTYAIRMQNIHIYIYACIH